MDKMPDWNSIATQKNQALLNNERKETWHHDCLQWLNSIANQYGNDYRIHSSDNFYIMSNENERYLKVFSSFLENTLKNILKSLDGLAFKQANKKHVVIIFADIEQYYQYISDFFPEEGEFGLSSGLFINDTYSHFVFPSQDISYAEPIAIHELTHACLAHLPIPTWLNEGLAVFMECHLGQNTLVIDNNIIARHQTYWNHNTIQHFWTGDSFSASDEGQELSYHLAHITVRNLLDDVDRFKHFIQHAHRDDAGESAARQYIGYSLSQIVGIFLGEGAWHPI